MSEAHRLMVVAGEPSGDAHAAALVKTLRRKNSQLEFFGATGPLMRAEGVDTVVNSDELAIMGILEVAQVFPRFLTAFRKLKAAAIARSPDAVILVDWPEFNLRLATSLHRRGLRVIYYISPQLWAWRPRRIRNIRRDVDLLLSILPFEAEWYKTRGVEHVEFVGHPLAGEVESRIDRAEFCKQHDLDPEKPIVSFLPGSRRKELERILPPMAAAIRKLKVDHPEIQPVVVVAPSRTIDETRRILSSLNSITMVQGQTREALAASDAAAIASGTATLEGALLETPMVVVYKESAVNWHTLGRLITVPHYGLVNLVAGTQIATELMQTDLTADKLVQEIIQLLDPKRNRTAREELRRVRNLLGEAGASDRAADAILKFLVDCH
ncbi:MAG TPA: lipid-A-disaccharide synthase [Pyrinomonadaceae bacterium]|nr:lipid-A-disaccharide synthase [Pyrinomonadaceae bacterium]